ncbi:MAG: bifunctional phosphoribosylaminoimidazolecarboxamide formyltransferase/IMP cyclohydrolase [Clostridiales bacterium]|nr:bifunctional phosphoribosylaminoimidazolecarboxamide formyltransferase/IMP cyclohydrolase [Clostridiales bacterium]MCF8021683.1 bifunctional phosphoribosylaminoimidazolecarboxamide formyltransferase/IMP cyclohydrolase [Clostridiales bacterium]
MSCKRALISLSDKTGVVEFAQSLSKMGIEIISTGGTAKKLQQAGIPVTYVSDVTGFPEILDGRVKTLHPAVHGGILAMRTLEHMGQLEQHDIKPIDLVAVNLYPFKETVAKPEVSREEAVENIDIGGPTLLRAAAKNHCYVTVVVNPERYDDIIKAIESGEVSDELRMQLALEAFSHTASYDAAISEYMQKELSQDDSFPAEINLKAKRKQQLRYGENPQQRAAFYQDESVSGPCISNAKQIHGKELSYNNILDIDSAFELVREFSDTACVIVKHNNPCGTACAENILDAYKLAYETDPVSAFGGIVAFNRVVNKEAAAEMAQIFIEAVIAPGYDASALEVLQGKKNLRILETGALDKPSTDNIEVRKVNGGFLVQDVDSDVIDTDKLKTVTREKPADAVMDDVIFAMTVVKHVKSNAIVVVKNRRLLGVGAGQMNRVGSASIALEQAGDMVKGAVMASDAFFPFRDTVDQAAQAGIGTVVQPGGSMRDDESIKAADEHGMTMVFTGMRHFRH